MRKKIFRSIVFSMLSVVIATMAILIVILNNHYIQVEENRMSAEASLAAVGVEQNGEDYLNQINSEEFRITWIASNGTVIYDSQADVSTMESHKDREEFKEAISQGYGEAVRYSDTLGKKTVYYAIRLNDGSVIRTAEDYDTVGILTLRLASVMLWVFVGAAAVSLFLANTLSKRIAEPINMIDLDNPSKENTYPEIQPLLMRISQQNNKINDQLDELHQRKKEFEAVTENMNEGIILMNKDSEILMMNETARNLLQLKEESGNYFFCDEERKNFIQYVLNGNMKHIEVSVEDKTICIAGSPIYSHKKIIGISILVYDNTEQYRQETMRREFTANVSHELKTPLQTIMGSAELLQNHLVKKEDMDGFYTNIRNESERMLTLIDDIIRLSQLDENTPADQQTLDLADIGAEVYESLNQSAQKKGIILNTEFSIARVNANTRLIYEIIYNLCDNAIRYTDSNGTVTLKTYAENDYSYLKVTDTGIGIPSESQSRVFERFYRVDKSHSRETGGTGLGLSIVKHAVDTCGGQISLVSAPGKGSEFTVRFIQDKKA